MTHKFQVSGKDPQGRIVVIGGDTADDLFGGMQDFFSGDDKRAWALLAAAQDALLPGYRPASATDAAPAAPAAPARNFRERPTTAAPGLSEVVCKHGVPAKLVPAGVSAKGAYGAFYACSMPRDQQCDFRANPNG